MAEIVTRQTAAPGRLFADVFGFDPIRSVLGYGNTSFGFDIQRTTNGYDVELPVAGFSPEQVSVTLNAGVLTISGESERRKFTRTLAIPDEIDPESVSAKVEHGMLTLSLRLHPKSQPRKIEVGGSTPAQVTSSVN
jgi:HSP20 family protein